MPANGLVISAVRDVVTVSFRNSSILESTVIEQVGNDLYALVDEQARRKIILDFRMVGFLSSQMLGVLIKFQKKAAAIKGRVIVCGLRADLMKVFKITRLDQIMEFAPDEGEAMSRLDGSF